MMQRPFRLRVLDALTDCLLGIRHANGYQHDLTDAVFRGRMTFGDSDPLPMVSILEVPMQADQVLIDDSGDSTGDWTLIVQGFVVDDKMNPTDPAHYLLADVKKALAAQKALRNTDDGIFGMRGLVDKLDIGAGVVRPPDDVSAKAYFWLLVHLKIVEDLADPF